MSYIKLADYDTLLARSIETDPLLQAYIDRYESVLIRKILGVVLGDLFIANVEPGPSTGVFKTLEDPIQEQEDSRIYESAGMRQILIFAILYYYVSETQATNSQSGGVIAQAETANVLGFENGTRYGEVKFNEALEWMYTVQWYACEFKPTDYPDYDGIYIRPVYSPLL